MLQIRHQVPGRVRFRIQSPPQQRPPNAAGRTAGTRDKASLEAAWMQDIAATMARQPGVHSVRLNMRCASLVVRYDPVTLTPERLRSTPCQSNASERDEAPLDRRKGKGSGNAFWSGHQWRRAPRPGPARQRGKARTHPPAMIRPRDRCGPRKATSCPWCAVQRRLTVWLLRSTVRCWWQEWTRHMPAQGARTGRQTRSATDKGQASGSARVRTLPAGRPDAWGPATQRLLRSPNADRAPLLTRMRERFGGGLAAHALAPEPIA